MNWRAKHRGEGMGVDDVVTAAGAVKAVFDSLRGAVGLIKDVKDALPADKQQAATLVLETSERQIAIAEAEIAQALGYQLCQCTFPPQIMLAVGTRVMEYHAAKNQKVFECARCGINTAHPYGFDRFPASRRDGGKT